MNPLEKREEVACAALRSPMSVEAQKVSVRKGETSSPLPSLIPSLSCRVAFANSACFTCDAENLAGEGGRERVRMRMPFFFFALLYPRSSDRLLDFSSIRCADRQRGE